MGLLLGTQPLLVSQIARADSPAGPSPAAQATRPAGPDSAASASASLGRPSASKLGRARPAKRAFKAKGKGLSYSDRVEDVEFTLRGLYGRSARPVPEAVRLLKDPKLLRLRGEIGSGGFGFVGSLGSDLHPKRIGRTIDWQAGGRYDLDDHWSVGLGYSYALKLDANSQFKGPAQQALRGAIGYSFSDRFSASATAVAWEPWIGSGRGPAALAAYFDLSFDF